MSIDLSEVERGAASVAAEYEKHQAIVKRIEGDVRLTPEARAEAVAEARKSADSQLSGRRDELLASLGAIDAELGQAEGKVKRLARPGLRGAEQWAEATARAGFVEQDLQATVQSNPMLVAQSFRDAVADGDLVLAWLIQRMGDRLLDTEQSGRARAELMRAVEAAWPENTKALAPIAEKRARVSALANDLRQVMTSKEKREFAARFGLNERYIP